MRGGYETNLGENNRKVEKWQLYNCRTQCIMRTTAGLQTMCNTTGLQTFGLQRGYKLWVYNGATNFPVLIDLPSWKIVLRLSV